jgi:D-alanyl-lipoteichoic acid acyltransferase DltB (MBOAT superfamily)
MENFTNILKNIFSFDPENPISLVSGYFLFAFTIFLVAFNLVSKKSETKKWLIILFSFFFYYKLAGFLCLIILIPTLVDFWAAQKIMETENENVKRKYMYLALFFSLGLLIYFKYTNFLIEIVNAISTNSLATLKIIVPVGISFYVFRSISYILDVYNEKIEPVKKLSDYVLYMSFFPLLISGPITRAEQFLPQLNSKKKIQIAKINQGLFLIFKGVFKKAFLADFLYKYVDLIFRIPEGYTGLENLVAIVCFAIFLYLDFSGYTDIVSGLAKLLGFDIGINFNQPFKAKSVTEFWRRWHISLSEWLRDYLFSPISFYFRKLKLWGAILAMFITFFICGIWHGTTFSFLLFGILHGLVLSWEIFTRDYFTKNKDSFLTKIVNKIGWIATFTFLIVTMLAMIPIPGVTVSSLSGLIGRIFTNMDWNKIPLFYTTQFMFSCMFILSIILIFLPTIWKNRIEDYFYKSSLHMKALVFIILVQLIVEMQDQSIVPFIYAKY